jgi:peptide/nickel transport system permease protein
MRRFVVVRIVSLLPTLLGVSLAVFLMVRLIPGTVVDQIIGTEGTYSAETVRALRAFFGLDAPLHVQYGRWLWSALHGDLGTSWRTGLPVLQMILSRLQVTAELTVGAMIVALLIGVPLGILSARRENTALDHVVRVTSPFAHPARNFGIMALPSLVLGTAAAAVFMRMTRSSLLEVMGQDFVRTARAKGLSERSVVWGHAFKNSLIPLITIAGIQVGYLLGGAVVTEEVFTLPGVGRLLLGAVVQRDYPLVQGTILFIAALFMLSNLVVDLLYAVIDPRIRRG